MRQKISEHEGKKYLRRIKPASLDAGDKTLGRDPILIDVYSVLECFEVTCQPTGHAIKKLLCAGTRGKGNRLADLKGALAAINRAIDIEESRDESETNSIQEQQRFGEAKKESLIRTKTRSHNP